MTLRRFFSLLGAVTISTAGILFLLMMSVPPAKHHNGFAWSTVLLFTVISLLLYWASVSAARSTNKFAFINLVSVSVFGKMAVSMGFLLAYRSMAEPANEWFVGIFLLVYVVYTIFEVWFMSKIAKT